MSKTLSVTIRDEAYKVLKYCSEKYCCPKDDLIDDAILEYYYEDKIELLENMSIEHLFR